MAKRNASRSNTAEKIDQILEHATQTRMLVEVMEHQNRITLEATLAYREASDLRLEAFRRDLSDRITVLELAVRHLSDETQGLRQDVHTLKQDVHTLKQDVHTLKQDVHTLKQDVHTLKQDVHTLKQDVHTLKQDVHTLKQDVHTLKQDVQDLRAQVSTLATKAELEGLERRVGAIEDRIL